MEEKTDTVKVKVVVEYEPHYVGKWICPYCNEQNWDYLEESEKNRTLGHLCSSCDEYFEIKLPSKFPPLK